MSSLDTVLRLGRGRSLPLVGQVPVPEAVARIAATDPARPAVRCGDEVLRYGELDDWASRLAARLGAAGAGRASRVGVLAEPSTAMVAAVLGILRAGAAYVPVDQAQPDRRIADVLADARVSCAVVTGATEARLAGSGLPLVRAEDTRNGPAAPAVPVTAEDPAYLIYTSGSTGEPKGVLVEHGHLTASTLARRTVYPGAPVFLLVSPLAFDSSVAGLWGTLTAGGCLVVATSDEVRDPGRLVELIGRHGVTRLLSVPALYGVLLDAADRLGTPLDTLDTVIVAGESLPETLVARHFARGCGQLVNEYGPTEATVWASYHRFDSAGTVSIGGPAPGVRLYLLDERRRPVRPGVDGELFIGGAGVARGYFGRPEATAEVFLADPFARTDGARMYRTGDLARWTPEGTLEFLGRRDHQVKIRGHRVELGAVETALRTVPGVRDAIVVPNSARTQLVAFLLGGEDAAPEAARQHLAERLSSALVPHRIRFLDRFPLTVSGKVDRNALAARADEEQPAPAADAPAPDGDGATTAKVAAAWSDVLKVADIPTNVNFFDLGGHSLTMFQLQDALESHTGTRPSIVALFRHTTVSAQAELIHAGGSSGGSTPTRRRASAVRARRRRTHQEAAK